MRSAPQCQPTFRFDPSPLGSGSVSACRLGPDLAAAIANTAGLSELLKSVFRVTVAQEPSREVDDLPDVSGDYLLCDDEVRFIPTFPFDSDVKYRVFFDASPLGFSLAESPIVLEFRVPPNQGVPGTTQVTDIFPSSDRLPENLLRFYVCFSNSMQRGRALTEISLLDSDGDPIADALYRPPVELWDRTMRRLTVLLDPGRLKRWVGPNIELGPPLRKDQQYTLQIGSGMTDRYGRSLREPVRKHFVARHPVREPLGIESWKVLPPVTGSRQALVVIFPGPLDWALLFRTITVESTCGSLIDGHVVVDQSERRWSFIPASPWMADEHRIRVASALEDVCGNNVAGAFERLLRTGDMPAKEAEGQSLFFQAR